MQHFFKWGKLEGHLAKKIKQGQLLPQHEGTVLANQIHAKHSFLVDCFVMWKVYFYCLTHNCHNKRWSDCPCDNFRDLWNDVSMMSEFYKLLCNVLCLICRQIHRSVTQTGLPELYFMSPETPCCHRPCIDLTLIILIQSLQLHIPYMPFESCGHASFTIPDSLMRHSDGWLNNCEWNV